MKITYSIFFVLDDKEIPMEELTKERRQEIANYMRKTPLETLGTVRERKSA